MSNEKVTGRPIGNLLYTKESQESQEKTKAELEVKDPSAEKVIGMLTDTKETSNEK